MGWNIRTHDNQRPVKSRQATILVIFQIVQSRGCDDVAGRVDDDGGEDDDDGEALSDYENTPNKMELDRRANEVRIQSGRDIPLQSNE